MSRWASVWHRLRFFVVDAWDELRHSPGVNLLAVATLASALFLAGLVLLVLSNVERRVEQLSADVRVEVYLRDDLEEEARDQLGDELRTMAGVSRVDYIDPDVALERYGRWAGEMIELIEELGTNPLPQSFEVFLQPGPTAEQSGAAVAATLDGREEVEQVRFDREWLRRLEALLDLARAGGAGLAILVFSAVIFVMASVLRLAVYARRDEIEIMLLVGATPMFVRGPFLVAGLAQGMVSTGLALTLVEITRKLAFAYAGVDRLVLLDLIAANPLTATLSTTLIALGLLVSCTSSWFAVRRSF